MVQHYKQAWKEGVQRMKNTAVRAFSISSEAETIIDIYATRNGFKSKSKALDTLLKDYNNDIERLKKDYNHLAKIYNRLLKKYRETVKETIENDTD